MPAEDVGRVESPSRASLPKAMPYRREQQFVLPLTVRIKLAIGLTVAQPLQAKTDLRAAEWLTQTVSQPDPFSSFVLSSRHGELASFCRETAEIRCGLGL